MVCKFVWLILAGASVLVGGAHAQSMHGRLLENRGQWHPELLFLGETGAMQVGVTRDAIVLGLADGREEVVAELRFEGLAQDVRLLAREEQPGLHHFFLGADPQGWISGVRGFGAVRWENAYEGIDILLHVSAGRAKYDLVVAPGADLSQVVVRCRGQERMRVDSAGNLVLETRAGSIVQPLPSSWRIHGDQSTSAEVWFRVLDDTRFGLATSGEAANGSTLVVDPELRWSTFWGGASGVGRDSGTDVDLDDFGNVTVVGVAEGDGPILTQGAFLSANFGSNDAFVTRFRQKDGALIYSSRIGGVGRDVPQAVDVDAFGRASVTGNTESYDFPVTAGAFDTVMESSRTAFVLRMSAAGDALEFASFLGESADGFAIVNSDSGAIVIGGMVGSTGLPATPGAFQGQYQGGLSDGFVARVSSAGNKLEWSTFIGGEFFDLVWRLVLDEDESVLLAGQTDSFEFPTTPGAFQTDFNTMLGSPGGEAFIMRLAADGSAPIWSTLFGGIRHEEAHSLAIAANGDIVFIGETTSNDMPVSPSAFQPSRVPAPAFHADAMVARLDASGSRLIAATYVGGFAEIETLCDVSVDASGVVTAMGNVLSVDYPATTGSFKPAVPLQNSEIVVTRLDPSLTRLLYSSYLGGNRSEFAGGLDVGPGGLVTLCGDTSSVDYPTSANALVPTYIGGQADAVITSLRLVHDGVQIQDDGRRSCLGPIQLNTTESPIPGSPTFSLYCTQAPPLAAGFLIVAPATASGNRIEGALAWLRPLRADQDGFLFADLGALVSPGAHLLCRAVFFDSPTCPTAALTWSNGLLLDVR